MPKDYAVRVAKIKKRVPRVMCREPARLPRGMRPLVASGSCVKIEWVPLVRRGLVRVSLSPSRRLQYFFGAMALKAF